MDKCFCGLVHSNYKNDEHAFLSDAYHDLFQGAKPRKEWMEAVFELLINNPVSELCPHCHEPVIEHFNGRGGYCNSWYGYRDI